MKSYKEFKEGFAHPNHKKLDANYNGKLDADDFKLLRKKKQSTKEDCSMKEDLEEMDLSFIKGAKPRGSVADQKAARDALIAKRKETNPNPPQLGSSSSDKYKLGDYDKKSNRSYSEEVELDEVSIATLDSYRKKSFDEPGFKRQAGRAMAFNKLSSHGDSKVKSSEEIDVAKSQIKDLIKPEHHSKYPISKITSMSHGRKIYRDASAAGHLKEEVEELDELSKKTLGSYVKKATSDVGLAGFVKGTTVNDHSRSKDYDDAAAMNRKRKVGIAKAVDKLTKESVELEEAIVKLDVKKVITKYPKLKDYGISSITMVNGELHIVSDYSIKPAGISDSQIIGAASTTYPKKVKESLELDEKLDPSMGAGEYVKDFKKSDAPQFKGKSPEKRRIMGVAAFLDAQRKIKEEVELEEARKEPAQVYHPTYSSAVQHARANAEKQGYTVSDDDWFHHVNSGPGKPSGGKTTRHVIPLQKDGKPSKKALAIQVHNRQTDKNSYELNSYIN